MKNKEKEEKAKLFTDMSFKWRDFRLQEDVNEAVDKRQLANLADAVARALIGNSKTGLSQITKRDSALRELVNDKNFTDVYNDLYTEIAMALRKVAVKYDK
jgi:hypothetical protein